MSRIKECFTSRYGSKGLIVNFDYKQLEVVALAVLSNCAKLKNDLMSGVDKHNYYAKKVYGRVTPELRTYIKRMTFQLQYGATAYGMHKSIGIPVRQCEQFIDEYFTEYPEIKDYHEFMRVEVESNRIPDKVVDGAPLGKSIYQSRTGRKYVFHEQVKQRKNFKTGLTETTVSFPPTQYKNYPVQGIATGDLVPLMVGLLNRYIFMENLDNAVKIVNTVHDSIMLDMLISNSSTSPAELIAAIKEHLESAPEQMKNILGFDWDVPTPVDVEWGDSWGNLHSS